MYGPFHPLNDSPDDVRKILASGEIWGTPPRGIFKSDIPKVKAYDGELPPDETGIEFETEVKPARARLPVDRGRIARGVIIREILTLIGP